MLHVEKVFFFPPRVFNLFVPISTETQNSGDNIPEPSPDLTKQSLCTGGLRPYQMYIPSSRISGQDTERTPRFKCMPGKVRPVKLREDKTHDIAHDPSGQKF